MSVKTHAQIRIALLFTGFFGGAILHTMLFSSIGGLAMLSFPICLFGGAYLLPHAFSRAVAAACPKCGGEASAGIRSSIVYVCRTCQAETNGAMALMGGEAAIRDEAALAAKEEPSRTRRFVLVFLLLGVVAAGIGVYLAVDSFRLVRDGVSTDAQVTNVTSTEGRDKDGNRVTNFTAHIQYQAGGRSHVLERGWSESPNSRCFAGCYRKGEKLKVIYLAEEPSVAKIHSIVDLYLTPALPLVIGLAFVAFASVMLLRKS